MPDEMTIDAREIMLEIQKRVWAQKHEADVLPIPDLDPQVEAQLVHLREMTAGLQVDPAVRASPLPIVGRLVTWWRTRFHNLILFYLNSLARQQAALMYTVIRTFIHMAAENKALRTEIEGLHQKVARLSRDGGGGE